MKIVFQKFNFSYLKVIIHEIKLTNSYDSFLWFPFVLELNSLKHISDI
jgi:hypothetical protein